MTTTDFKPLPELEYEMALLREKLTIIERKKATLLDEEGAVRTEMQRIQNQISRFKGIAL